MKENAKRMRQIRDQKSQMMQQNAIRAIKQIYKKGNPLTVKALMDYTGYSRSYFYNNSVVADFFREKQKQQIEADENGTRSLYPQKAIIDRSMQHEIGALKSTVRNQQELIRSQEVAIERLKKENDRLKERIELYDEEIYKKL